MSGELLEQRQGDRILRWRLHNPARRNAVSPAMLRWIAQRCPELRGEVVVIEGDAEGFCSGFDLTELAVARDEAAPDETLIAATWAMRSADATFVAAIHGHAIGAGVELAATCDFRIATTEAEFRVPAGRLCVVYHARGLMLMHAVFGAALTRRMVLAGERVGAAQAEAAGALHDRVEFGALGPAVDTLCAALVEQAPASTRGNRTMLRTLDERPLPPDLLAAHEQARASTYASEDHAEARAAIRERRSPRWRDR